MDKTHKKVVVVGQGYVGLPIAMRACEAGYEVVGYDVDDERLRRIRSRQSYIEDVTDEQLAAAFDSKRYVASSEINDCANFDFAVITVPTPLRDGVPDLSYIEVSAQQFSKIVTTGSCVILESTTYPGTTEEMVVPILEDGSGLRAGIDFFVGYSPERIDPGNSTWRFANTPKIVSGIDEKSLQLVNSFYSSLVQETVPVSSPRVAEMSKLLENTFRHVNIALVNELSMFASQMDVSVWEAIDAASTKPFGFMRFYPGPGVGGHCLPIDPSYLSWKVKQAIGESFRFIELANDVNDHMPKHVVERIIRQLNRSRKAVNGSQILVLGLAYKKNTGDIRESPSLAICELLANLGASIKIIDSWVPEYAKIPWARVELSTQEVESADIVVVLTDHDDINYSSITEHAKLIFDARRRTPSATTVEYL